MATDKYTVTEEQKEFCAINTMRYMVEMYSEKHKVPFETAFFQFTRTCVYEALFDYSTGIWKEGPVYLLYLFEESFAALK